MAGHDDACLPRRWQTSIDGVLRTHAQKPAAPPKEIVWGACASRHETLQEFFYLFLIVEAWAWGASPLQSALGHGCIVGSAMKLN